MTNPLAQTFAGLVYYLFIKIEDVPEYLRAEVLILVESYGDPYVGEHEHDINQIKGLSNALALIPKKVSDLILDVAVKGEDGKDGIDGKDAIGAVTSVNNIEPVDGNVTLVIPDADLTSYAKKSELSTVAQRNSWDAKETPTEAQAKATKALTDAKVYTDAEIAAIPTTDLTPIETQLNNHESRLNILESGTGKVTADVNGLNREVAYLKLQQDAVDRIDGGVTFADDMGLNRFGMELDEAASENVIIRDGKMLMIDIENITHTAVDEVVINQAYSTAGNGGRKLIRLSNGWLVVASMILPGGGDSIRLYVSKNGGGSFELLATQTRVSLIDVSLSSKGMDLYVIASATTEVRAWILPITENISNPFTAFSLVPNQVSTSVAVDSIQTAIGNVSLAIDPTNGHLHAAWTSKNATYPNSFNIRYSKSVDGGVTWSVVEQVTNMNAVDRNITQVSIGLKNGSLIILSCEYVGIGYYAKAYRRDNVSFVSYTLGSQNAYKLSNINVVRSADGMLLVTYEVFNVSNPTIPLLRFSKSISSSNGFSTTTTTIVGTNPGISENSLGHIYITYQDSGVTKFIKSTDNGDNWSEPTIIGTGTNPSTLDDSSVNFTTPLTVRMGTNNVLFNGDWSEQIEVLKTTASAVYNLPSTDYVGAFVEKTGEVDVQAYLNDELMSSDLESNEYLFQKNLPSKVPVKLRLELSRTTVDGGENDAVTRILGGRS